MRVCQLVAIAAAVAFALSTNAADRAVDPIRSRIPREPLESTAIAAVGYSKRLHALEIEFRDGLIYRYLEVPNEIYSDLVAAESKARFYNQNIKGKFYCVRVRQRE